MTIEFLRIPTFRDSHPKPHNICGVTKITCDTPYGYGYFVTSISYDITYVTSDFRHVKCVETGKYFVQDGKWVAWLPTYETADEPDPEDKTLGAWLKNPVYGYYCSECFYYGWNGLQEFCPSCGAKMILEEE